MTTPDTARPARPPLFFDVPAAARWNLCKCGKRQYWIRTPQTGKLMPVDCDVEGGRRPRVIEDADGRQFIDGRGVSHFTTCSHAAEFRRRKGD